VDGNAANAGNGVSGKSSSGNGVLGDSSSGAGVSGTSSGGNGVSGTSSFGDAVIGESPSGEGGFFENSTSGFFTLLVENTAAGGYPLMVKNSSTDDSFFVDYAGDGTFTGIVTASGYNTDQPARGGSHLEAFSSESTRATIEDTGTARLESGEGVVRFDSAFESTIDTTRGYQVFLTPKGETRGWLYVAAEYEGGFIVREGLHGRSSVYFDYRVVAHPYGASDARLPQLVIKRPPIQRLPRHTQPQQP
ncbi:MAG TPA: hypothetical protein VFF63_09325, partial [Candidatus Babeliales bacterium]|nr:hypothetical protein [Candidatus Babeliales bacterium]